MLKKGEFFLSIPKSLYVSLKSLGLKKGIGIPIVVHYKTKISIAKNSIILTNEKVKPFSVRLGFGGSEGVSVNKESYFIVKKGAKIFIKNNFFMGAGFSIRVDSGYLSVGNNVGTNKNCFLSVSESVTIGDDCIFGWNTQVRDSDGHEIEGSQSLGVVNIGMNNWIGAHTTILKNVTLGDGNVVALGSIVTSSINKADKKLDAMLIGGYPAKVIKKEVKWNK